MNKNPIFRTTSDKNLTCPGRAENSNIYFKIPLFNIKLLMYNVVTVSLYTNFIMNGVR